MSENTVMWVIFEKDTGKVLGVSPKNEEKNSIPVDLEDVKGILDGTESKKSYRVEYNPKIKELELQNLHLQSFDGASVDDFIYEVPEGASEDSDIAIEQNIPETCWKVKIGKQLKRNLRRQGIRLNSVLNFSITAKHDPNILYKTLSVDFSRILNDNYVVLDFDMQFEREKTPVSVFTSRRFDTYSFTRIFND